ncbi:hypothetical protein BN134_3503 [Cronobacter dublinensis 1210]|uniref:Uncharacterized protein n=1 Tax=Cronobacter dublinensis 1210 TaxID=1208656 RepID=A0ABM9QB41_9ENTR|nr:hypothetical protein BN134_3503 [Cronobacter dublinensis 1210]
MGLPPGGASLTGPTTDFLFNDYAQRAKYSRGNNARCPE